MINDKKLLLESYKDIANNEKPFDKEEEKILKEWKNLKEEDIQIFTDNEALKEFKDAQKGFKKEYKKTKQVTMRIDASILSKIKNKALDYGMSYQTYINMFLYQLANDKFKIELR